uniref:Uncharacterized protein n=1 Tax=Meloidogyne enterolobii TaxID=390850 RepID=A0A6V7V8Z8_MELEN|nr:unnamed protein product [Meloidogyne enterolobii]
MLKIAEMVTGDAQLKIVEKNKDITVEHFLKEYRRFWVSKSDIKNMSYRVIWERCI